MTTSTALATGYLTVSVQQIEILQRERIHALELDHYRATLLCREELGAPGEEAAFAMLADYERRLRVHLPAVEGEPEGDGDTGPDAEDDAWVDPDVIEHDSAHAVEPVPAPEVSSTPDNLDGAGASNDTVTGDRRDDG